MSERVPVTFEVVAADSGTELFLIDGNFKLVKKGIGRETFSVSPGIYKLKARSGKTATERMIVVRTGMTPIKLDPVMLTSAMPLRYSAKTHEFHMTAASQAGLAPNLIMGSGSAIVIVARQWTAPNPTNASTELLPNPARGLALRDMNGAVIVDVEQQTSVNTTFDPCVTLYVVLNPGGYRLALTYKDGRRVEQTLVACDGWQTQVYLLLDNNANKDEARVDLVNGAITMRKPTEGFDPDDPKLRVEQIARGAYSDGRKILSDDIRSEIARPDASPMLALLGAHLLIREAKEAKATKEDEPDEDISAVDNRAAVRTIVQNLRAMIGAHPDVEAIAIGAGNPDPTFVFDTPPMYRASWRLLLKASAQQPDLIPAESFLARVAERVWGEGPWMLWVAPDIPEIVDRSALWQTKARELFSSIDITLRLSKLAPSPTAFSAIFAAAPSPLAAAAPSPLGIGAAFVPKLKSLFARRSRTPFPDLQNLGGRAIREEAVDQRPVPITLNDDQRRALVKRLGIPMSSINAWLKEQQK
jgi:hypothetical protein